MDPHRLTSTLPPQRNLHWAPNSPFSYPLVRKRQLPTAKMRGYGRLARLASARSVKIKIIPPTQPPHGNRYRLRYLFSGLLALASCSTAALATVGGARRLPSFSQADIAGASCLTICLTILSIELRTSVQRSAWGMSGCHPHFGAEACCRAALHVTYLLTVSSSLYHHQSHDQHSQRSRRVVCCLSPII